ncbi:MAG: hypothetical protein ACYCXJ_07930, partial [Thermoleophilia bacterium]
KRRRLLRSPLSRQVITAAETKKSTIGLLNEKPLHASLKEWCSKPGDRFEVKLDRFVIDIVRDGLLLEIQTGNFASMRNKLRALVREHRVRLVYPIAREKWIVKLPKADGDGVTRRKSPKRGRVEDMFGEMVSFPQLLAEPNFSLEVLLINEEETRRHDEKGGWRRRGWATDERRLLEVVESRLFRDAADLRALIPEAIGESFTTADMAEAMGIRRELAQRMAYCLRQAGVVELTGKRGRSNLYRVEWPQGDAA